MRPYISRSVCTQCGECIAICPYEVFAEDRGIVIVAVPEDCIECGACIEQCKATAIYFDD